MNHSLLELFKLVVISNSKLGPYCATTVFQYFFIGMEKWLVGSRNLEFYESFDDVDEKWRTTIRPQMFPPKEEDLSKFNLNRW